VERLPTNQRHAIMGIADPIHFPIDPERLLLVKWQVAAVEGISVEKTVIRCGVVCAHPASSRLRSFPKPFEMRIDLVTLCDAAVEVNGRLHVLGTIDYFWSTSLPYLHAQCALALRLRWEGHERSRRHKIRVQVIDADGSPIAGEFQRKFTAPQTADDDIPAIRHVIVELQALQFSNFGPYAIRVEVDGEELASLPFSVVRRNHTSQKRAV
jgi:hypothetical protein